MRGLVYEEEVWDQFSVWRELDRVCGSRSYRVPPAESSATLATGEDSGQMSGEPYGVQDHAWLREKRSKPQKPFWGAGVMLTFSTVVQGASAYRRLEAWTGIGCGA